MKKYNDKVVSPQEYRQKKKAHASDMSRRRRKEGVKHGHTGEAV